MYRLDRISLLLTASENIRRALSCCRQNESNEDFSGCSECPFEFINFGKKACVLKHCDLSTFALHIMTMYDDIRYPDRCYNTLKGGDKNGET